MNEIVESARRPRRDFYEVYDPNIFDDLQDLDTFIDILNLPPVEELVVTEKSYGTKAWHYIPASSRQLEILRDNGYNVVDVDYSRGQASILIDRIFNKPPSEKQLRLGLAYGANPLANWTSRSISAYINKAKETYKFNPLLYRLYDFIMEYASQIDELPLASS